MIDGVMMHKRLAYVKRKSQRLALMATMRIVLRRMETETEAPTKKAGDVRLQPPSRWGGARLPVGKGRPKGTQNKVTKTIREAIEIACRDVTDSQGRKGLAAWLLERAQGNVADRQIFAAMVSKALPLQVQAGGQGGITINLGWLAGRGIVDVTPATQSAPKSLIDNRDNRIINQDDVSEGETDQQADKNTPPPPINRQGGEGA